MMKSVFVAFILASTTVQLSFAQEVQDSLTPLTDPGAASNPDPVSTLDSGPTNSVPLPSFGLAVCLAGTNQVPANASPFRGSGKFRVTGNTLTYSVRLPFPNLSPTGGGIYGPARSGTTGDAILIWTNCCMVPGIPGSTFRGGWEYAGSNTLTPEQLDQLKAGLWYVNIKSASFPAGELRGQLCATAPDADSDGDGIPNQDDLCPDTPPGAVVDATGCSIQELVPCDAPWTSHEEYVQAVTEMAATFLNEGRINSADKDSIVQQAQMSNCGNLQPRVVTRRVLVSPGLDPAAGGEDRSTPSP